MTTSPCALILASVASAVCARAGRLHNAQVRQAAARAWRRRAIGWRRLCMARSLLVFRCLRLLGAMQLDELLQRVERDIRPRALCIFGPRAETAARALYPGDPDSHCVGGVDIGAQAL